MSTFFQQTAQAIIAKHIDRFPLLKLEQVIDWQLTKPATTYSVYTFPLLC